MNETILVFYQLLPYSADSGLKKRDQSHRKLRRDEVRMLNSCGLHFYIVGFTAKHVHRFFLRNQNTKFQRGFKYQGGKQNFRFQH